ncbi:MAG: peptidoglycan-binding domain-containing protein [Candidatus Taylorbacteria bacterium]
MNKINRYHKNIAILVAIMIIVFVVGGVANTRASTCISLNADLGYGAVDNVAGGPVSQLQGFLRDSNYLVASSTGYFGQATLSAVKAFQTSGSVSSTGYVGPLTRAMITQKSCIYSTSNTSVVGSSAATVNSVPPSVSVPISLPAISRGSITSPVTGQVISIGSSTVIRWSRSLTGNYDLSLEQPGGAGVGFIANDQFSGTNQNQYIWKVGKIFLTQSNSYQTVPAGTYRIRLRDSSVGDPATDQLSGWFTVIASQFSVSSIVPPRGLADDSTSFVLFGSGLTPSTHIYFDSNYSGLRATNRYVSPDGSLVVFTVPTTVPAGSHMLYINDGQSSSPLSMPFVVSTIQ